MPRFVTSWLSESRVFLGIAFCVWLERVRMSDFLCVSDINGTTFRYETYKIFTTAHRDYSIIIWRVRLSKAKH